MVRKLIAISIGFLIVMPSALADSSVNVFAASSLTDAFTQLGKKFESDNPGIKIKFSFQASSTLATQIKSGAPADIFVSAEPFSGGKRYISNRVVLGVAKNSKLRRISDLNGDVLWIQCAHEVPCGHLADMALANEGITTKPASLEPKVTTVLAKLVSGEVDAGIIYRTDVIANSGKLRAIDFQDQSAAKTTYQIAQLRKSPATSTFMAYLKSKAAIKFLQSKGFLS